MAGQAEASQRLTGLGSVGTGGDTLLNCRHSEGEPQIGKEHRSQLADLVVQGYFHLFFSLLPHFLPKYAPLSLGTALGLFQVAPSSPSNTVFLHSIHSGLKFLFFKIN